MKEKGLNFKVEPLTEEEKAEGEHHVLSAIMWMKGLPESKDEMVVRIENIPSKAN